MVKTRIWKFYFQCKHKLFWINILKRYRRFISFINCIEIIYKSSSFMKNSLNWKNKEYNQFHWNASFLFKHKIYQLRKSINRVAKCQKSDKNPLKHFRQHPSLSGKVLTLKVQFFVFLISFETFIRIRWLAVKNPKGYNDRK